MYSRNDRALRVCAEGRSGFVENLAPAAGDVHFGAIDRETLRNHQAAAFRAIIQKIRYRTRVSARMQKL